MSKPNHRMRGQGRRIGYGLWTSDLKATKGDAKYHLHLAAEICDAKHKPTHLAKLKRYLGRTK